MSLKYQFRPPVVRFTKKGDVEFNEVLSLLKRAFVEARQTHPGTPQWDVVVDLRGTTEERSDLELRGAAMALAQHTPILSGRVALVVADPRMSTQFRRFSTFATQMGQKPRVFRTLRDADAWLKRSRAGR